MHLFVMAGIPIWDKENNFSYAYKQQYIRIQGSYSYITCAGYIT